MCNFIFEVFSYVSIWFVRWKWMVAKVNDKVAWCGGDEVFPLKWRVLAGTLALQCLSKCRKWCWMCKKCGKMNCTLRVTRSHPYIKDRGANCLWELRRLIRRLLEATCMAWDARGRAPVRRVHCCQRAPVRHGVLLLACSFRRCALIQWTSGPRVIIALNFCLVRNNIVLKLFNSVHLVIFISYKTCINCTLSFKS